MEKFTPIGARLLVKPAEPRKQVRGSLVIPTGRGKQTANMPQGGEFIVVALGVCGPGASVATPLGSAEADTIHPMIVVGSRIVVGHAPATPIMLDGEQYLICEAINVEGVIEDGNNIITH